MARPKLGESETKRLQMVITEDELRAIEDWQFANRLSSKSEAIRRLCQIALIVDGQVGDLENKAASLMTEYFEESDELRSLLNNEEIDKADAIRRFFELSEDHRMHTTMAIVELRHAVNAIALPLKAMHQNIDFEAAATLVDDEKKRVLAMIEETHSVAAELFEEYYKILLSRTGEPS